LWCGNHGENMNSALATLGLALFPLWAMVGHISDEDALPRTCHLIYDEVFEEDGGEFPYSCEGPCEGDCEVKAGVSQPAGAL